MKILVWGLGYVGSVTAACLASAGHEVIGVDTDASKVQSINSGISPVSEPGLDDLIQAALSAGRLRAVTDAEGLVAVSDLSVICVGTPSNRDGSLMTASVERVVETIGLSLRNSVQRHLVVVRSTLPVGTVRGLIAPLLEHASCRNLGEEISVVFNPEFLRESTAIADYWTPPYTIFGTLDGRTPDAVFDLVKGIEGNIEWSSVEEAEMLKLVGNAFHGLKIAFANEIGRLGQSMSVDALKVMRLICADTKLNISPAYLRPGFAFGGSCLPKDIRALNACAAQNDISTPLLASLLPSNTDHIAFAHERVLGALKDKRDNGSRTHVTVLGLGFKANTDDVRESPVVALVSRLCEWAAVSVYDPQIDLTRHVGANREYLEAHLPQAKDILIQMSQLSPTDCIVVTQHSKSYDIVIDRLRALSPDTPIINLA
jgi:GDP-mannose 6-dehydrogenase